MDTVFNILSELKHSEVGNYKRSGCRSPQFE